VTDQEAADQALKTGVELGGWLAVEARPKLTRWAKSGDARVRVQALLLRGIIEERVKAGDWAFLADFRERWVKHAAEAGS